MVRVVLSILVLSASLGAATAAGKTITGRIKSFECGDNCYLTIVDARGKSVNGLCEAKACAPWNETTEIPKALIGRKARVTTGIGVQRDGAGHVMGRMTSFRRVELVE